MEHQYFHFAVIGKIRVQLPDNRRGSRAIVQMIETFKLVGKSYFHDPGLDRPIQQDN